MKQRIILMSQWHGGLVVAAVTLVACADPGSTAPRRAADEVRLSLAVEVAAAARVLAVDVGYRNAAGRVSLLHRELSVDGARQVPLAVNIASCLGDAARETAEGTPAGDPPQCVLRIQMSLLDGASAVIDAAEAPPLAVRPGGEAEVRLAVGTRASFVQLAAGAQHSCRIVTVTGGGTRCWGANGSGQLGNGTNGESLVPSTVVSAADFTQLGAGTAHSCALTRTGDAVCWGDNALGQIAGGGSPGASAPVAVTSPVTFTQLVVGGDFACGLGADALTYCWGNNQWGALGDGSLARRSVPAPIKGGFKFRRLVAGGNFACGLTDGGPVYCWGAIDGRTPTAAAAALGPVALPGSDVIRVSSLAPGYTHACGLTGDGTAACIGKNTSGQLGDGTTTDQMATPVLVGGGLHFATLAAGGSFTCGIATDSFTYCWGANGSGQLGDGTTVNRSAPTRVAGNVIFATLAAGADHMCGATSSGATYCWGQNTSGQLGDGTKSNHSVPAAVK
jgi:alpha-tubulin suppressor-like RCC1 family protein